MPPDDGFSEASSLTKNLPSTLAGWQAWGRAHGVARLDILVLAEHVSQRPRTWLLAHDDEPWLPMDLSRLHALLERRREGVPVAYLTGWREFFGLTLSVTPDVLVPRPETEGLVEWALELLDIPTRQTLRPCVVDLGTGSGAIALALKHAAPELQVHAVDASQAAVDVARSNAQRLGLELAIHEGQWWHGDWVDALPAALDLVVANPPYLADDDPYLMSLRHEPRTALVAPDAGMADLKSVIDGAVDRLRPGGWVVLEHGHTQGLGVRQLLSQAGFVDVGTRTDLAGLDRCSAGRRPIVKLE